MNESPQHLRPIRDLSKFAEVRGPRPMLAREADAVYWMSRYVERAEHIARLLLVRSLLLADAGDLDPDLADRLWWSVPAIQRLDLTPFLDGRGERTVAQTVMRVMAFDAEVPNSLVSCLTRARENARGVREAVSAEMWEALNGLYWSVRADDAPARFDESPDAFLRQVMTASMLFQGLTDQSIPHDQRWLFAQLGKYIERIDFTCRVVSATWEILTEAEAELETPVRNIHWMGLLRTCCSIEAYRRSFLSDLDPLRVVSFLTLEPLLPRTIRYAVHHAHEAACAARVETGARRAGAAERILGRLDAQLEYAEVSEIVADGVPAYLRRIESRVNDAAIALQKTYFAH